MKAVVLIALCGCTYAPGRAAPTATDDAGPDSTVGLVDAPAIDAPPAFGPWSAPVQITELNTLSSDDDPSLTDDLLEIYFGSTRNSLDEDIYVATRAAVDQPFSTPQLVAELNTGFSETTARVSRDGLSIMFASDRTFTDLELYLATRPSRSAAWGTPVRVAELGSLTSDYSPFASSDLLTVIFASSRDGGEDLFTSQRASTQVAWDAPVKLGQVSTAFSEVDPLMVDADTVYFSSDRGGNIDLYVATRAGGTFTAMPVTELNSLAIERDIWVSGDQRTAVFSSTRDGGDDDIYISTRSFE